MIDPLLLAESLEKLIEQRKKDTPNPFLLAGYIAAIRDVQGILHKVAVEIATEQL